METKPKAFSTVKKLSKEATIFGLYYNTFFLFMVSATVILLISSNYGFWGFAIGILIILGFYTVFNITQVKVGPKRVKQYISNYKTKVKIIKGSNANFKKLKTK